MPIFQGLPGKSRAGSPKNPLPNPTSEGPEPEALLEAWKAGPQPKKMQNPLPNPSRKPPKPPEAPEPLQPLEPPEPPLRTKPQKRPGKHHLRPDREGGEWEFRALARNPKRYKVGWMPA